MFVVSVVLLQVESDHSSTGVLPSVRACVRACVRAGGGRCV
jgi:hypothetical protein